MAHALRLLTKMIKQYILQSFLLTEVVNFCTVPFCRWYQYTMPTLEPIAINSGTASQQVMFTSVARKLRENFAGIASSKSVNGAHSRKLFISTVSSIILFSARAITIKLQKDCYCCGCGVVGMIISDAFYLLFRSVLMFLFCSIIAKLSSAACWSHTFCFVLILSCFAIGEKSNSKFIFNSVHTKLTDRSVTYVSNFVDYFLTK